MAGQGSVAINLLLVVAVPATIFAVLAGSMLLMDGAMMGMTGGGATSMTTWWAAGFLVSVIALIVSATFAFRLSRRSAMRAGYQPPLPPDAFVSHVGAVPPASGEVTARLERFQEAAVLKALEEDERRLYLLIREGGGQVLQRELVANGSFSKSKITRLLDKLERKGLVVRERSGATNRIRLTWKGPRTG